MTTYPTHIEEAEEAIIARDLLVTVRRALDTLEGAGEAAVPGVAFIEAAFASLEAAEVAIEMALDTYREAVNYDGGD